MWQHVRVDTVMLVTSYSPGAGAGALYTGLCTSSSVAESRQMISIETSISETFTQTETSETSEDVFSQHFETDIQKLETEAPSQTLETGEEDSSVSASPSTPPRSFIRDPLAKRLAEDQHLTNGSVNSG